MLKQMINPDLYHGELPWNKFEGWYFKISSLHDSFVLIPGISKHKNSPHSFVQLLDGREKKFNYFNTEKGAFKSFDNPFRISVSDLEFSMKGISGSISNTDLELNINIEFKNVLKWNPQCNSHRSMGFYNFIPFMQCYSQVCIVNAEANGFIDINGKRREFRNSFAYSEKNWGNSFPYAWYWIQCNNFKSKGTSLTVSTGDVPMPWGSFHGFLAAIQHEGQFHQFTTINGSKLNVVRNNNNINLELSNATHVLSIETKCNENEFVLLHAPDKDGQMKPSVLESISSKIYVKLFEKNGNKLVFEDKGINSGIEFGGKNMF